MSKNQKSMTDENVKLNNGGENTKDDYTFVQERIVSKPHRFFRLLRKILINIVVPLCLCILVIHLYLGFLGDKGKDDNGDIDVTPTYNSIHIDYDEDESSGENDTQPDDEDTLLKLEERIKGMMAIVSVIRKETIVVEPDEPATDGEESEEETTRTEEVETVTKYTGVIVDGNGPLYILIPSANIDGYTQIYSQIADTTMISTTVYSIDKNTGLAILKIEASRVTPEMSEAITVATFAGNADLGEGDDVIYYGSIVGNGPMFLRGHISNNSNIVNCVDINYDLLITDIMYEKVNDGFLFNTKGQLVGIAGMDYGDLELPDVVAAGKAIDLKYVINNMLNDMKDIYMGIVAQDVSPEVEELAGGTMPDGIYVKNVMIDSPAYNAGILAGDIIYAINDDGDVSMEELRKYIESMAKGDTLEIKIKRKIGMVYNRHVLTLFLDTKE